MINSTKITATACPVPTFNPVYPADHSERIDSSDSCESIYYRSTSTRDYTHIEPCCTHKNKTIISTPLAEFYVQNRLTVHAEAVSKSARKTVMHFSHVVHKWPKYCIHQFIRKHTMNPTIPRSKRLVQPQRTRDLTEDRSGSSCLTHTNAKAAHWQTIRTRGRVSDTTPVKTTAQGQMKSHSIRLNTYEEIKPVSTQRFTLYISDTYDENHRQPLETRNITISSVWVSH